VKEIEREQEPCSVEFGLEAVDPAAVFAASNSLWQACHEAAAEDRKLNLSNSYSGIDGLMREVMRIATQFEAWACQHVAFEETIEPWPYFLQDKFGQCCLSLFMAEGLAAFAESDCLHVALQLNLPVRLSNGLRVPLAVQTANPRSDSHFVAFRILTMRYHNETEDMVPFTAADDPFDEDFEAPIFGLYGVDRTGELEHIADRSTYEEAADLVRKIAPEIQFPTAPTSRISTAEIH
jgi:hypothetical protein